MTDIRRNSVTKYSSNVTIFLIYPILHLSYIIFFSFLRFYTIFVSIIFFSFSSLKVSQLFISLFSLLIPLIFRGFCFMKTDCIFIKLLQLLYFWLQLIWGNILSKWNPVVLSILWSVNLTLKNGKTEFHWSVCSRLQADHGYIQTSTCIYTNIQFKCVNAGLKSFATTVNG